MSDIGKPKRIIEVEPEKEPARREPAKKPERRQPVKKETPVRARPESRPFDRHA